MHPFSYALPFPHHYIFFLENPNQIVMWWQRLAAFSHLLVLQEAQLTFSINDLA